MFLYFKNDAKNVEQQNKLAPANLAKEVSETSVIVLTNCFMTVLHLINVLYHNYSETFTDSFVTPTCISQYCICHAKVVQLN